MTGYAQLEKLLAREVNVIENTVNQISHRVLNHVSNKSDDCSGDQILVDCFNCMKLIEYNANRMNNRFAKCFNDADDPDDVKKCLQQMQKEVHQLKNKLEQGKACQQVSKCVHKMGDIDPNSIYCLSHQGNTVTNSCMDKIKDGHINKLTHNEIDQYITDNKPTPDSTKKSSDTTKKPATHNKKQTHNKKPTHNKKSAGKKHH